jgi:hypothetical protein
MIDLVYYNDDIRCYRNGVVERLFKKGWRVVKNTSNDGRGYNQIRINGRKIFRHRIIAFCFLGLDDIAGESGRDDCIDHKDRNKLNNSVANLRITTPQGNNQNRTIEKGYYWNKGMNKWKAQIGLNGKRIHLGYYTTEAEAHQAYSRGKEKYHIL